MEIFKQIKKEFYLMKVILKEAAKKLFTVGECYKDPFGEVYLFIQDEWDQRYGFLNIKTGIVEDWYLNLEHLKDQNEDLFPINFEFKEI
jgi:hypothetical protein